MSFKAYVGYLKCSHVIGKSRRNYLMKCDVLKEMPDGKRVKVRVYGIRNWDYGDYPKQSRVRYVDKNRITC